jgi:Ca2+-binding RTX toxin-like protein
MATMSIPGGGNHNVTVYGSGNVIAGSGNDSIRIGGSGSVIVGDGRDTIAVLGNATVSAGWGNDRISIGAIGHVSVGGGNDTLTLSGGGEFRQSGLHGHDTINLGSGNDTIYEQGNATVQGLSSMNGIPGRFDHGGWFRNPYGAPLGSSTFGSATIAGGELQVLHSNGVTEDMAVSGKMTLVGGQAATEFIGGSGSTVMRGGSGNDTFVGGSGSTVMRGGSGSDTFVGGSGHDTMVGGSGHNVFEFLASEQGGQHVITNFVSSDQLDVEGQSLQYMWSHNEITTRDGNTYISVDGGKTTVELQGVTLSDPVQHINPNPINPHPHDPFN